MSQRGFVPNPPGERPAGFVFGDAMTLDIFFDRYLITVHAIVVAFGLVLYVAAARALPQRRDPSAAIAWVVALALLPYLAIPIFLMFGSRKLRMRDDPKPATPPLGPPADEAEAASMWARRLGRSMGLAPAAPYEALRIHADGSEARRAVLEVIASAKTSLDVCTFILARDRLGEEIAAALRAKAEQGVRVRLLIDGIGAWLGGRLDVKALRRSGVEVVKFVPPFRSILRGRANLRNHRKMLVADTDRLWCGGRNFAAEYFEGGPTRSSPAGRCATTPGTTSASTCKAPSRCVPASSSRRTGPTPRARRCSPDARRPAPPPRPTSRWRSWCRADPTRSTTRCSRCFCRAASWRAGASSPSRPISFRTPTW